MRVQRELVPCGNANEDGRYVARTRLGTKYHDALELAALRNSITESFENFHRSSCSGPLPADEDHDPACPRELGCDEPLTSLQVGDQGRHPGGVPLRPRWLG